MKLTTTSGSDRSRWRTTRARRTQNFVDSPQFGVLDSQPLVLREHVRTRPVVTFAPLGLILTRPLKYEFGWHVSTTSTAADTITSVELALPEA